MVTFIFILTVLLWIVCPLLIGLILLQGGAGDISSAFGGGGSLDSTLGVGAGRKMSKITAWLAAFFFIAVIIIAIPREGGISAHGGAIPAAAPKVNPAPATPAAPGIQVTPTVPTPGAPASAAPSSSAPAVPSPMPVVTPPQIPVPAVPALPTPAVPAVPTPAVPTVPAPENIPVPSVPAPVVPAIPEPPKSGIQLEQPTPAK